jgi:hypothetical protein
MIKALPHPHRHERLQVLHPGFIRHVKYADTPHGAHRRASARPQWFMKNMTDMLERTRRHTADRRVKGIHAEARRVLGI